MIRFVIGVGLPLLILMLSLPMILGKVPPNGTYGFRTPKTMSSPEVWYAANRAAGWFMLAAMVVSICFNLVLWWTFPEWPLERMLSWMTGGMLIPLLISLLASFSYLRRL